MKKLILSLAILSFTFGFAQNEDKMSKTVTTKTTIKSSKGEDVAVKQKKYSSEEKLQVENNNKTNQTVSRKPVKIEESTTFSSGNESYTIAPDKNGYTMMSTKNGKQKMYGKIRKMKDHNYYILAKENENSFGYFDEDGNFVVESYDADNDAVYLKKYNLK
ncbi:hypothetical protein [Mesonia aestuariivivens]|uniref:Uncharacterized protein n=1 Tax=Mesonia aestuariivivens TaxID=2796128 RepID=A0ABS6VYL4_9FLAO|nr:hypothetical protein [Mesonia aestuariivivens]MBW2960693.1 hypothetical protein [Mesonia aestuariivivens]